MYIKVSKSRKQFMVSSILPNLTKKHYPEYFLKLRIVFVPFLGRIEDTIIHFEVVWPLVLLPFDLNFVPMVKMVQIMYFWLDLIFLPSLKIPFRIEGKLTIRIHGIFLSSINCCHFLQTPLHWVKLLLSNFSNIFSMIWGNLSIKKESSILNFEFYLK